MEPEATRVTRFDRQSRLVIRRFGILVVIFTLWSMAIGINRPLVVFAFMTFVAGWVELGMAAWRREKITPTSLGGWDLAAALFGLHCLASGLA